MTENKPELLPQKLNVFNPHNIISNQKLAREMGKYFLNCGKIITFQHFSS